MRRDVGGILVSLLLITSIAAVMPMAVGVSNGNYCMSGYKFDTNDFPIEGWTIYVSYVDIFGSQNFVEQTTTDFNGYWMVCFEDLSGSEYNVTEEEREGWTQIEPTIGHYIVTVSEFNGGGQVTNLNFTNSNNASIGDYVWEDLNANGIQDDGEEGIFNVTVNLYHHSVPSLVATMKTNANGSYHFSNLTPGNYSLEFILPDGYGFSPPDQGDDDALDTDSNTCSGKTAVTTLDPAEDDLTWDSGMYETELYCISGYKRNVTGTGLANWTIFIDANGNGQLDNEECRATTMGAGTCTECPTTGDDGYWAICGLVPGNYTVCEVLKSGWTQIDPIGCHEVTITNENVTNINFINQRITNPGTGTPGYWKNHPEAWPVDEINIGGVLYNVTGAIAEMNKPVNRDMTYAMFQALVAAKLNVLIGNDASCIADTITTADAWMSDNPLGSEVTADSDAWQNDGDALKDMLDAYNNGLLCAPSRDSPEEGEDTETSETDTTTETTIQENGKDKKKPKK